MYFDEEVNQFRAGVGIILLTLEGKMVLIAKKLAFRVPNNEAEYEASRLNMEALIALGVIEVKIFGDSMLVFNQTIEEWDLKEHHLRPYLNYLQQIALSFQNANSSTFLKTTIKWQMHSLP